MSVRMGKAEHYPFWYVARNFNIFFSAVAMVLTVTVVAACCYSAPWPVVASAVALLALNAYNVHDTNRAMQEYA